MTDSERVTSRASLQVRDQPGALHDASLRFLALSDELLAITGFDGRVKWASPAHERLIGWSPDELLGRPYIDVFHPDDRERLLAEAAHASSGGSGTQAFDARLRCKDGSHRWFRFTNTPSPEEELVYTVARELPERRGDGHAGAPFMELSVDPMLVADFDGYWREVNPAFEVVLGWRADELVNQRYADLVHEDDRQLVTEELASLTAADAQKREFRARMRCSDGSYRSLVWSATSSCERRLIYAVCRDESEREQAQAVVREAEERFRSAFDEAPIGMALVSLEKKGAGCFLRVNKALREITGYDQEQLIGTGFHDIAHPDDYDPDLHYVPWMKSGDINRYEVEKRLRHRDGHYIWSLLTTSMVRDGHGRPLYLISQIQDITERKQADEELRESRERLQSIIDNTTAVIYMKDSEGRFQLVNRRFEMLYGVRREEAVGKTSAEVFPDERAGGLVADDSVVLESGASVELEEVVEDRDGPRTFLSTRFPLFDPKGSPKEPYAVCAIATDITERKRAEEALRASEEHFRQIVNTAHDAFVSMDRAGVITAWNPEAERTFGWSEEEVVGRSVASTILPQRYREAHYRGLENFLDTGRGRLMNRRIEIEAVDRNGREFPIEMTVTAMRVAGEYMFNAFLHDISDRRQAEEQIRRLADIVESSGDAIIGATPEGLITTWNRGAERQYGYSAEEAIGNPIGMLGSTDGSPQDGDLFNDTLSGRDVAHVETRGRRKDGSAVDVAVTMSPIRDAIGHVVGVSYMSRDITERKQAERALREVQEGFRTAFEDAPIGVALQEVGDEAAGQLLQVNHSLCAITGFSAGELLDLTFDQITHPEDLAEERSMAEGLFAGEIPNYRLEKRLLRKDGSTVWVMHNASTVHDSTGRLLYGIAQVEDISERKRAEERLSHAHAELERRAAELERSNGDLQQFAYAASHDLSEPLRMVSSYVQLLARKYEGKLDSDADEFIHYAVDGVVRMQALIEGLLLYSRAGTSEYAIGPVDTAETVEGVLMMVKTAVEESGAEITVDPLPTVEGDEIQLTQLFQNLIANALKFVVDGPPRVHVTAERRGDDWHFSVADNGIGIDPAHAQRIFNVFQRLHGRGEYPGSGIGLAICKRIVERHHGRIWVEAGQEGGSIFRFTIPVTPIWADTSLEAGPE